MNIFEYTKNLEKCKDLHKTDKKIRQYQENKEKLGYIEQGIIQETLLPVMNSMLPFTTSPISFSNQIFYNVVNHENLDEYEREKHREKFITYLTEQLNTTINTKYKNLEIILYNHIKPRIELIGTRKYDSQLKRLEENLEMRKIDCEDLNLVDNIPSMDVSMKYSKEDLEYHIEVAEKKAKEDVNNMFGFSKEHEYFTLCAQSDR